MLGGNGEDRRRLEKLTFCTEKGKIQKVEIGQGASIVSHWTVTARRVFAGKVHKVGSSWDVARGPSAIVSLSHAITEIEYRFLVTALRLF